MQTIVPGYRYAVENLDCAGNGQTVQFVRKELNPENGKFETADHGTTNEEVLKVLIERVKFLQAKSPCRQNAIALTKMEEALMWFGHRTAERKERGVEDTPKP